MNSTRTRKIALLLGAALTTVGCVTTGSSFPEQPRLSTLIASPPDYEAFRQRRVADREAADQNRFALDGSYVLASEVSGSGRLEDRNLEREIAGFASRLLPAEIPGKPEANYYVSGNPSFNAVALETGDVVVFRGATEAKYADELAFLLGHESSHILDDHFKDRERRDKANQILAGLLTIAILADGLSNGGETGNVTNLAVGAAFGAIALNELSGQAWALKQESEADQLGLEMMVARDYSPLGAVELLTKLRDTERKQKEHQTAQLEAQCGKRQTFSDQFAKSILQGMVGSASLTAADLDPVCQQWNSLGAQIFEDNSLASEKRLTSIEEYISFRYPDMISKKAMQPFLDKNGREITFLEQASPDGAASRANAADKVIQLLNEGRIEEARPLARKLLRSKDDAMPAARWALYRFGRATGDPKAIEHLEFAADANTANDMMLQTLVKEYEDRTNYEGALRTVRRLKTRTVAKASSQLPLEIRYLRLLGRTEDIPAVLTACREIKEKTLTATCENEAKAPDGTPASEAVKAALATDIFARAVITTELAEMLVQPGDYTIYVPTNVALASYFDGVASDALLPENREKLRALVEAHIVAGRTTTDQGVGHSGASLQRISELESIGGGVIGNPLQTLDASIVVIDTVLPERIGG